MNSDPYLIIGMTGGGLSRYNCKVKYFLLGLAVLVSLMMGYKGTELVFSKNISQPDLVKGQAARLFQLCANRIDHEECYSKQFSQLATNYDLDTVTKTLFTTQDLDPNARACHLIGHYIMLSEVGKDPEKWKETLKKIDSNWCTGGFVHGVLEAHSRYDPSFEINAQTVQDVCTYVAEVDKHPGGDFNCAHIMGHILLATQKGSIPRSVPICAAVGSKLEYECQSGVFMENETLDNLIAHGVAKEHIPWNAQTTAAQEKICGEYTGVPQTACWREIVHMYAYTAQDDPQKVYKMCQKAANQESWDQCYFHGTGIMAVSSNFDYETNAQYLCQPYEDNPEKMQFCLGNAIGSLIASSTKFADQAILLCKKLPENFQGPCYGQLGNSLVGVTTQDERVGLCADVPMPYQPLCTRITPVN